jgi:Archaeal TRASH domain
MISCTTNNAYNAVCSNRCGHNHTQAHTQRWKKVISSDFKGNRNKYSTIKSKYDRLVHIGFIKSVSPILDFDKVTYANNPAELNNIRGQSQVETEEIDEDKIRKGMVVQMKCNYCRGPIAGKTHVLKFANFERFFCCTGCKSSYKKKYHHKIKALIEKHLNKQ